MFGGAGPMKFNNETPMIHFCFVNGQKNGIVYVTYKTKEIAEKAINMYNGITYEGCLIGATKSLMAPQKSAAQQRGEFLKSNFF